MTKFLDASEYPAAGQKWPLAKLRNCGRVLKNEERKLLIEQTQVLLENFYAHLPLKKAMLAIDPVQRCRLLLREIEIGYYECEMEFLQALLCIFIDLRDLHTSFTLPTPYNTMIAFLPFAVGEYLDDGESVFVIKNIGTEMPPGINTDTFKPGAVVTHWNGTVMGRRLTDLALTTAGANEVARKRRALYSLTVRPLAGQLLPSEDWVDIVYHTKEDPGTNITARFEWMVWNAGDPENMGAGIPGGASQEDGFTPADVTKGVDHQMLRVQHARRKILDHSARSAPGHRSPFDPSRVIPTPFDNILVSTVDTMGSTFGYLKLWNFNVADPVQFARGVGEIVAKMPPNGLIIDIRGNPGGMIQAGEMLLQLFTGNTIVPQHVHFRCTPSTLEACRRLPKLLQEWEPSIRLALQTGYIFSQGYPVTDPTLANSIGRKYNGPVVLLIDAVSYSTSDFFAAGFQDNQLGTIIGTDCTTGAGGGNVWYHDMLATLFKSARPELIKPMPAGANMTLAMRQTTRVGVDHGLPVEGIGVCADVCHQITYDDLVSDYVDLIAKAGKVLLNGGPATPMSPRTAALGSNPARLARLPGGM